jgi:TolB-like protein
VAILWLALSAAFGGELVLAVAPFDAHTASAELQPLGKGLADMLVTDLDRAASVRIVERQRLQEVLSELKLQESAFVDPKTAAKVGKGVGAGVLVVGALTTKGSDMRVDARVVDVATGEVRFSTDAVGPAADFFVLEKEIAAELVEGLKIEVSSRERIEMQQTATTSLDAAVSYGQALQALDLGKIDEARAKLEAAVAADDGFVAAKKLLDQYKVEVAAGTAAYTKSVEATYADADDLVARCEKGDCAPLANFVTQLPGTDTVEKERELRQAFLRKVLASKIPADTRLTMGDLKGPPTVELAGMWLTASCMVEEDWPCVVSVGREFMKKYPTSIYFPAVSSYVDAGIQLLEAQGKK